MQRDTTPEYKKSFTRDFALCIVQIWCRAEGTSEKRWLGNQKFPFQPFIVFEKTELGVSCYMDEQGIAWMKNYLLKKAKADPAFVLQIEREFGGAYDRIRSAYLLHETLAHDELLEMLRELELFWSWFEAGWWLWETQPEEREGFELPSSLTELRMRTQDLIPDADRLVRASLDNLFPELKKYTDALTEEEIRLKTFPSREELERRQQHCFVIAGNLILDSQYEVIEPTYGIHLERLEIESYTECHGQIAFPGIVRGRVKFVASARHMDKVEEGDILVSSMTLPDMLPAMKKAVAFVTDEGGIMCHAAIMARELKKPCIVGTKIATQVLKDGDMVEVDAERGVVRKL